MKRDLKIAPETELFNKYTGEYPTIRSRKKTIIFTAISGVFGLYGLQYFYLRKYWRGLFVIPAVWNIAVFIAAITGTTMLIYPFLLAITGYSVVRYYKMPKKVFDQKYNHYQKCSGCGRRLHLLNKPTFGQGKLSDGTQICYPCYSIIRKKDEQIIGFNKIPYETISAMEILEQALPEKKLLPSYFTMQKISTRQILEELDEVGGEIINFYTDLIIDEQLLEQYTLVTDDDEPAVFFKTCLIYDLGQITKLLCNGSLDIKCTETFSFAIVAVYLWSPRDLPFLDVAKNVFGTAQNHVSFKEIFDPLKEIVEGGNPFQLKETIYVGSDENKETFGLIPLALLPVLKKLEHPLFASYLHLLHRFAESVIFNNGQEVIQQNEKLKKVHAGLNRLI